MFAIIQTHSDIDVDSATGLEPVSLRPFVCGQALYR